MKPLRIFWIVIGLFLALILSNFLVPLSSAYAWDPPTTPSGDPGLDRKWDMWKKAESTLKIGMTIDEVKRIYGPPDEVSKHHYSKEIDEFWTYYIPAYRYRLSSTEFRVIGGGNIHLSFTNGRLTSWDKSSL